MSGIGIICREKIESEEQFSPTAVFGTKEEILDRFYNLLAEKIKELSPEAKQYVREYNRRGMVLYHGKYCKFTMPADSLEQLAEKKIRPTGILIHILNDVFDSLTMESLGELHFDESVPEKSRAYWGRQFSGAIGRHGDNPENTGPKISLEFILLLHAESELTDWLEPE